MTSQAFIEKALRGENGRKQACASVFVSDGVVYSYGYHYPLVKIIGGKAFVNTQGYSATTGKHISWAFSAAASIVGWDKVFHAPLNRGGGFGLGPMLRSSLDMQENIKRQMMGKKRKDTRVYDWLQTQYDRTVATINAVEGL